MAITEIQPHAAEADRRHFQTLLPSFRFCICSFSFVFGDLPSHAVSARIQLRRCIRLINL